MKKPQSKSDLWLLVYQQFALRLPHRIFTPGHSSPLHFLHDALSNPHADVAAWACRSGGKTLTASVLAALEFLFTDELQARVLAGSEDQAKNLYQYWTHWCNGPLAHRLDDSRVRAQQTRIAGGRFSILAASQKRVRGPKVHRLFEDELDEIDPAVDAAAVGMITSRIHPGRTVYTSTWHRADGLMGKLVSACPANGVRLHRWNLWEAIGRCPPDRHDEGRNCETCPLAPVCVSKAREVHNDPDRKLGIAAEADGIYPVPDAIKAFSKIGQADWEAEFECRRPRLEGSVFPEFDPLTHRCDDPPAQMRIFRTVDWGHGVFVCLWIGEDACGNAIVLDTYRAERGTLAQHARHIRQHRLGDITATYCDPAGRSANDQTGRSNVEVFREYGIDCKYTLSPRLRSVSRGIRMIRAALAPASGTPRLHYVPNDNNRAFIAAMQNYRNRRVNGIWIDKPQDPQEYEHIPDALRYFFVNRARSDGVGIVRLGAH